MVEVDVCGPEHASGFVEGSPWKKVTGPSVARQANARICRGSTPRDGRECSGTTRGKRCLGLPGLRGQRDLLSLWPEVTCREASHCGPLVRAQWRRDRRSAGRADGRQKDLGVLASVFRYLRNVQGYVWNHKRVYPLAGRRLPAIAVRRICCELDLNLRPLMVCRQTIAG